MNLDIRIVNKHHGERGELITRGTALGNPFRTSDLCPRSQALELYEAYLEAQIRDEYPTTIQELTRLYELALKGPLKLQCVCAPKPCHGDIIKKVLLRAHQNQEENQ
jgi:hypothetical protein